MSRFILAGVPLVLIGVLPAGRLQGRHQQLHLTYCIKYDNGLNVRTKFAPPSEVKRKGRALTRDELEALKDPGLPGYRATISDLTLAMCVSIYLEKETVSPSGEVRRGHYPSLYCFVHHNRLSTKTLVLYRPYVGFGLPPPPYLIGNGNFGNGIPLPNVSLKTILVHAYYPRR